MTSNDDPLPGQPTATDDAEEARLARDDIYRLVALLWQLERLHNPVLHQEPGDFRVAVDPPALLPPTGIPGIPLDQAPQAWAPEPARRQEPTLPRVNVAWVEPAQAAPAERDGVAGTPAPPVPLPAPVRIPQGTGRPAAGSTAPPPEQAGPQVRAQPGELVGPPVPATPAASVPDSPAPEGGRDRPTRAPTDRERPTPAPSGDQAHDPQVAPAQPRRPEPVPQGRSGRNPPAPTALQPPDDTAVPSPPPAPPGAQRPPGVTPSPAAIPGRDVAPGPPGAVTPATPTAALPLPPPPETRPPAAQERPEPAAALEAPAAQAPPQAPIPATAPDDHLHPTPEPTVIVPAGRFSPSPEPAPSGAQAPDAVESEDTDLDDDWDLDPLPDPGRRREATVLRRGREAGSLTRAQAARLEEELRRRFRDRSAGGAP